ncbi:MAG TPA: peroxide stress protein YaaA, partial [Campylobacterales bacterium]|nr:peroxide stress protein YaaA [Campylobacterales bacterium]
MKILLAPSETKVNGGNEKFVLESLLFQDLTATRKRLLHQYINILQRNDLDELSTMFGLKKVEDINYHNRDIVHELTMKAIKRYTGVAFDHLDYDTLNTSE